MKKAIIYIRTSTELQTPELQLRDIQVLNPPADHLLLEEQQSAWKENVLRPQFDILLKTIKARKVTALYVWSLDRLYRNRKRLVEFLTLCKNYGVKVHSYNQQWVNEIHNLPEPWNEIMDGFMLQIVGWIAEDESKVKSNRVKMAIKRKESGTFSHKGNKWGRKGYSTQIINSVMELHQQGKSIRAIAKEVQGYSNHNGKPISKSGVHKIIAENSPEKGSKTTCPQKN
ncbi:recombinase family protein [Flavisolibacter tropicus]|uniref:Resolvase/invertase-type recombinase catalytic domain-containing protein n=1 Tax=Flavisolibacter tropicus TaxID=1492898 RepID=A0A172U1Z4_9BACT|nr:recombinase family protein [Flavisolibacter tropicus]ANE53144.1 hypothetical protein SY85_24395 [Flavisolibacter tropicus]